MTRDAPGWVIVRQQAGYMVKAMATDNYRYLRRYGAEATRRRCGPALSRTSIDKLELRLALFRFDGVFWSLTFDDDHLPNDYAGVLRAWRAFMRRLRRCRGSPVDFYVYRIEGLHGDKRWHIHVFLRGSDFSADDVRHAWGGRGGVEAEPWTRARVLERRDDEPDFITGYRGLAKYFTKELPQVGKHPWGCSKTLSRFLPKARISTSMTGVIRPPPGAVMLPADGAPRITDWGVYGYCRYLLEER